MRKYKEVTAAFLMAAGMFVASEGLAVARQEQKEQSTKPSTNQTTTQNTDQTTNQQTTTQSTDQTTNQDKNKNTSQDTNKTTPTTPQDSNRSAGQDTSSAVGSKVGNATAMSSADSKFMMTAAMGGMTEVQAGRLAAERGSSDAVKQIGQRLVDDHTKANDELTQLAGTKGIALPTALDAKHQAMIAKLSSLSGEQFDREFIKAMLKDHRKDVAMFQKQADRGADAEVKAFAAKTLPTLQEHMRHIEAANTNTGSMKSKSETKSETKSDASNTSSPSSDRPKP